MVERDDEDKIVSGESWRLERLWKMALHQDWYRAPHARPLRRNLPVLTTMLCVPIEETNIRGTTGSTLLEFRRGTIQG